MHLSNPGSHLALESHSLYALSATTTAAWNVKCYITFSKSQNWIYLWNKSFLKRDTYKKQSVQLHPSINGINHQCDFKNACSFSLHALIWSLENSVMFNYSNILYCPVHQSGYNKLYQLHYFPVMFGSNNNKPSVLEKTFLPECNIKASFY